MALTRAQLLSGDSFQGTVLNGQVQGVKQGTGVVILPDGTINFDGNTATGVMRLNNPSAFNGYVWPALSTPPALGAILQSSGGGNLIWTTNYVPITSSTGAAKLPVGLNAQRPTGSDLAAGEIRYNSEEDVLEYYDGSNWVAVVAVDPTPGPTPTIGLGLAVNGTAIKVSIPIQYGPPATGAAANQAMDGSMYWDDTLGILFIRYRDADSAQWVQAIPSGGGGGGGTVTSVAMTAAGGLTQTGSPVTSAGAITVGFSMAGLTPLP